MFDTQYHNLFTGQITYSARQALKWREAGATVFVYRKTGKWTILKRKEVK